MLRALFSLGGTSGVEFFLGDGRSISLPDQEQLAITYLKEHRDELRAVAESPGVDAFILGLVYIAKLEEGVTGVALDWPPEVMQSALDVGITPIHYITYDHPSKPEQEPYAYFYLTGTFNPDEITADVGVAPSETTRTGESVGSSGRKALVSLWGLRSRLQPSDESICMLRTCSTSSTQMDRHSRSSAANLKEFLRSAAFLTITYPQFVLSQRLLEGWPNI
jgi:hypothetical protein